MRSDCRASIRFGQSETADRREGGLQWGSGCGKEDHCAGGAGEGISTCGTARMTSMAERRRLGSICRRVCAVGRRYADV